VLGHNSMPALAIGVPVARPARRREVRIRGGLLARRGKSGLSRRAVSLCRC
jgi:hypothetical protein